jgi:hypothetical protein
MGAASIVHWNGTNYTPLAGGLFSVTFMTAVRTLTLFDDGITGLSLYAGGAFTGTTNVLFTNVARWDGAAWSGVASGINGGTVRVLLPVDVGTGPSLFAGGPFNSAGLNPAGFLARLVAPAAIGFVASPAVQSVPAGQPVTLSVAPTGPGPFSYQWLKAGVALVGETASTYTIDQVGFQDTATYSTTVTGPCSTVTAPPITLLVRTFNLSLTNPSDPPSLSIVNSGGLPGAAYFTAISLDPRNASSPGQGAFGGLFIDESLLLMEIASQSHPFLGTLNAVGGSSFLYPPGTLPPSLYGMTVTGVTVTYNPASFAPTGLSTISSATL